MRNLVTLLIIISIFALLLAGGTAPLFAAPASLDSRAAEPALEVRTSLVAPGEPGRLYALLSDEASSAQPATNARLLISDDLGERWAPFPGGLPVPAECLLNVNLDYFPPTALYASTCRGIYRWSDVTPSWQFVSPEQTGMIAVVYGKPQVLWATRPFSPGGAPVIRSEDGGATWSEAASAGMLHFNGVVNVAIDPHDENTVYAIIWPKYAGSYLRRRSENTQWQTMPTPLDNTVINTGLTIDGNSGALYVVTAALYSQLWRSPNPNTPDLNEVRWELVHDFGEDTFVELLASGWSPQPPGLALYANVDGALHQSLDGGQTWNPFPISPPDIGDCLAPPAGNFLTIWQSDPELQDALGCPTSYHPRVIPDAWQVQTSYQPFEHGEMIWSDHIGWYAQPVIYVIYHTEYPYYHHFNDTFDPAVEPVGGGETPPNGLVEPLHGFGKVWREQPGVRETLGWATASETPGAGRFQMFAGGNTVWISQTNQTYVFVFRHGSTTVRVFDIPFSEK